MIQKQAKRRRPTFERMLKEFTAMRLALEGINQCLRFWVTSQGQPRCPADDRAPEAIERKAKTQGSW